jgi:sugar O-acyltransferase (sialic acid O-acetyltransferase NeuD family)
MKKAIIFGTGSYASVYYEYLKNKFQIVAFADKKINSGGCFNEKPIIDEQVLFNQNTFYKHNIFVPIGDNRIRNKIISKLVALNRYILPNFIHEKANINKSCLLGKRVYILPGVNVMPHTKISDNCMISVGSNISHHSVIGEGCFISHGVNIGANINVDSMCFFGINSTVMTGVKKIEKNSIIGAGSVVIRNVKKNSKMVGNPARNLND